MPVTGVYILEGRVYVKIDTTDIRAGVCLLRRLRYKTLSLTPRRAAQTYRLSPAEAMSKNDILPVGKGQFYLKSNLTFSFSLFQKTVAPAGQAPSPGREPSTGGERPRLSGEAASSVARSVKNLACPLPVTWKSPRVCLEKPKLKSESKKEVRKTDGGDGRRLRDCATPRPVVCTVSELNLKNALNGNKFERQDPASGGRDRRVAGSRMLECL